MKNKILTWLALSVIFCLSSFETKAQSVYIPVSYTHLTLPTICSV